MPVISAVLTAAFDRTTVANCDYLQCDQASMFPDNFRCINRKCCSNSFELFEFTHRTCPDGLPTPPPSEHSSPCDVVPGSSTSSPPTPRKRRMCTPTMTRALKADNFRRDISAAILQNSRRLGQLSPGGVENRYIYAVDDSEITANSDAKLSGPTTLVTTQLQDMGDYDGGYMRIFSRSARRNYLNSLNYRNMMNLGNHWVLQFSVAKYFQHNYDNIFHLPGQIQLQYIRPLVDYRTANDEQAYDKLKSIEKLLSDEVLSESDTSTDGEDDDDDDDEDNDYNIITDNISNL